MLQETTPFIVFLVVYVTQYVSASLFAMLSQGRMHVLNAGDRIDLQCEFHMDNFDLFDNPIQWLKIQHHEISEINMMSNIKDPFDSTGKFEVSFLDLAPKYILGLTITNLSLKDSGNYTCEVRAPRSQLLGQVTHRIFVRSPVSQVAIFQNNSTLLISEDTTSSPTTKSLSFVENESQPLRCIARGGNPPPDIEITLGKTDITNMFSVQTYPKLSGERGFRLMETMTILWKEDYVARPADDGRKLRCKVTVPGVGSHTATAKLYVHYAPVIECQTVWAAMGDVNVHIACSVYARPGVNALFWMLDDNGTVVSEGEVVNEYWILNMDLGENGLQTTLYMRKARLDSFRSYTVIAENSVAVTSKSVQLQQLYPEKDHNLPTLPSKEQKNSKSQSSTGSQNGHNGYIFIRNNSSKTSVSSITLWIIFLALCCI